MTRTRLILILHHLLRPSAARICMSIHIEGKSCSDTSIAHHPCSDYTFCTYARRKYARLQGTNSGYFGRVLGHFGLNKPF